MLILNHTPDELLYLMHNEEFVQENRDRTLLS